MSTEQEEQIHPQDRVTRYVVRTLMGLEPQVVAELEEHGAVDVEPGRRSATFGATKAVLYRYLHCTRFAVRVLRPVFEFKAKGPDALYAAAVKLDWGLWVDPRRSMALDVTVNSDEFPHDQFAMFRLKDAMSDHFKSFGRGGAVHHLDINRMSPEQLIHLHIAGEQVTISLDLIGKEALFKRGYRAPRARAPLNEVLTAGLLGLAGWRPGETLIDPMCGSGTFAIEAGLWTAGVPIHAGRRNWTLFGMASFDGDLWREVGEAARQERIERAPILASDWNKHPVEDARESVRTAGLEHLVRVEVADFLEMRPPRDTEPGLVVLNPPYGQRVHADDLEHLYGGIGGALKHRWSGWRAALLFPKDLEAHHRIGLKPTVKHTVMNGPLTCTWAVYDLFKGKRADHLSGGEQAEADAPGAGSEAAQSAAGSDEGETVRFRRPRVQVPKEED
jgi:putative N6-adenine-specific DNA methylase